MRDLSSLPNGDFDVVLAADNALPHLLSPQDLVRAAQEITTFFQSSEPTVSRSFKSMVPRLQLLRGGIREQEDGQRERSGNIDAGACEL